MNCHRKCVVFSVISVQLFVIAVFVFSKYHEGNPRSSYLRHNQFSSPRAISNSTMDCTQKIIQPENNVTGHSETLRNRSTPFDPALKPILVNTDIANAIAKKIRLLCFVTTEYKSMKNKVKAINETWGAKCDKIIYVLTGAATDKETKLIAPDIMLTNVADGREHLTAKSRKMFLFAHAHLLTDYDWFLKCDDDSYYIIENLKFVLSKIGPGQPAMIGRYFKRYTFNGTGYLSGGAGYAINREALNKLVDIGFSTKGLCPEDGGAEDISISHCLAKSGVSVFRSVDKFGRQLFNPNAASRFIVGTLPDYLFKWDLYPPKLGNECCSQLVVSFHYMEPALIRVLHFLLYRTSIYGRVPDTNSLNELFEVVQEPKIPAATT